MTEFAENCDQAEIESAVEQPVIGPFVKEAGGFHLRYHQPAHALGSPSFENPKLYVQDDRVALVGSLPESFDQGVLDPITGEPVVSFHSSVLGLEEDKVILSHGRGAQSVTVDGSAEPVDGYYDDWRAEFMPTAQRIDLTREQLAAGLTPSDVQKLAGLDHPPKFTFAERIEALRAQEKPLPTLDAVGEHPVEYNLLRAARYISQDVPTSPKDAAAKADLIEGLMQEVAEQGKFDIDFLEFTDDNPYALHTLERVDLEVAELAMNGRLVDEPDGPERLDRIHSYLHDRMPLLPGRWTDPRPAFAPNPRRIEVLAEEVDTQVAQGRIAPELSPYALDENTPGNVSPLAQEHARRRILGWRGASESPAELPPAQTRPKTVGEAWAEKVAREKIEGQN